MLKKITLNQSKTRIVLSAMLLCIISCRSANSDNDEAHGKVAKIDPSGNQFETSPFVRCSKLLFRDGFGDGAFTVDKDNEKISDSIWGANGLSTPASTATVVRDPGGTDSYVGRFMVPDDGESFRAELQRSQFDWGRYRYEVSHYIPSGWPAFEDGTIITQWHGFGLKGTDGKSVNLNPPIALAISGLEPFWELHMFKLVPGNPGKTAVTKHKINVPITYDKWNKWAFDITWSRPGVPGLVVVTLNGEEVVRVAGVNNYHQQWSPYFQMGIYRPSWRPDPKRQHGGPQVVMYHKDITVRDMKGCL